MLEHHPVLLSLEEDLKFCVWNLLLTSKYEVFYFIIRENDEVEGCLEVDVKVLYKAEVDHGLIA